jgi:2'-5' RNA ligase
MQFDEWYKNYPRKVAKGDARKAWTQMEKVMPPLEQMLKVLEAQKKQEDWRKDGGKFIPYPATYLRQERWDDELTIDLGDVVEVGGQIVNWWESATGIEKKGRELGLKPEQFNSFPDFKSAVMRASMRAA